jgi:DNA polymerase III subunit alpha
VQSDEEVAALPRHRAAARGPDRNASTHAAGVVIGDRPLTELVPALLAIRASDMPVTSSTKTTSSGGLVKFDFLGLTTLTILDLRAALLRLKHPASTLDLTTLPLDDAPTYEMLRARRHGRRCSSWNRQGMRDLLRACAPDRFEDLIALVALYPPGPMANIPELLRPQARRRARRNIWIPPGADPGRPTASWSTRNR